MKPSRPPHPPYVARGGREDPRRQRRRRQVRKRRLALAAFVLFVTVTVVVLAIAVQGSNKAAGLTTSSTGGAPSDSTTSSTAGSTQTSTGGSPSGSTTTSKGTDTSYTDATKSINITQASTGSGADKVTYFVVDIKLTSAKDLQAGLADNAQGAAFTSDIAAANNAIFAINGDYFRDRSDGIIIRNGVIYRDKPARVGLAIYTDGTMKVYDETKTSAAQLLADGVWHTYSFGPALLVDGAIPVPNDFSTYEVVANPQFPIQGSHPRTGIGLIDANHFILIDVDGRHPGYSKGVTLEEFAQMFKKLGCTTAYNIDGGASATVYFRGKVINQPKNHTADPVQQRATSDIIFIK